jgi:hypothetical protein
MRPTIEQYCAPDLEVYDYARSKAAARLMAEVAL